eukprot:scaffold5801_cov56-Cyclotella_meneghiniana.AAC.3
MNPPDANNLIGRIHHVITPSSDNAADKPAGNKRPRPWDIDGNAPSSHRQGFILITDEGKEIHLTMPNSIIRTACYAAAAGQTVELSGYTLIHYENGRGKVVFDSRDGWVGDEIETYKKDDKQTIMVAEVHRGGLAIKADENYATTTITQNQQNEPTLTLKMFSTKEQVDSTSKKRKTSKGLNVSATVDAVSPIFTHDSERPFALMELYQSDNTTTYSVVAVIRGEHALCMHAAIHPGQNITLMGVVSRSWKVPEGFRQMYKNNKVKNDHLEPFFERLYQRTPDRVILIDDPNCIHFDHEYNERTLPSTVKPLTSVDGCIESVNYYRYSSTRMDGKTENILHFVTLKSFSHQNKLDDYQEYYDSDGNDESDMSCRTVRINLIKYSLSPHVLLGLQPGAILRAINIHRITSQTSLQETYVACLRSTVSIECCATDSNSHPKLYFVFNVPPFKMVPNHRIAKILRSSSSNSIPSTRYFVEDSLRLKIQQLDFIHDPDELTRQLGMLMLHHYKTSESYETSKPTISQVSNMRDPYSEFFDHAHYDNCEMQNECGNYNRPDFSNFCCQENSVRNAPNIVRLNVLRDTCVQDFTKRIATFCSNDSRVSSGSTSSYHYYSSKVYSWGQVNLTEQNSVFAGFVVHENCKIPFLVHVNGLDKLEDRYLGWIQVKSALVSCLCLGRIQCNEQDRSNDDSITQQMSADTLRFLPSSPTDEKIIGHNFVFAVSELVFIGSIQFIAIPVAIDKCDIRRSIRNKCTLPKQSAISIQDCLKQTCINQDNTSAISIVGRLTRQRFQFRKSKRAQYYEGWSITLSDIDENNSSISASFLQTVEVYVRVPVEKPSDFLWITLKATLRCMLQSNDPKTSGSHLDPLKKVSSDQLAMGLAFLRVSECNSTHPILCGGWESCNNQLLAESETCSTIQTVSVHVKVPFASREIAKLGYQRFRCHLEDLEAFITLKAYTIPQSPCQSDWLDCRINTGKFLPGMLNRRMCRVKSPIANTSQLLTAKNQHNPLQSLNDDIPTVSLLEIHQQVCKVLSEEQPSYLLPSLLIRIHKARILGINFCRARAECTQCFEFLIFSSRSNDSVLVCPSGCGASHAAIKWECSAVIDDCTGQAKLYAERESALLLLGSALDVDAVERGAWTSQDGVFFQPALPPSSYLQRCIKEASSEAKKHNTQMMKEDREKYFKSKPATTYDFISTFPLAKSEYLLQQYCRQWYQKHYDLNLDLFCRCKPLSNEVTSVNRSEIQVAKAVDGYGLDFGVVQTCTLPPLKLVLEDACTSLLDSDNTTTTCWDMLRKLSRS